MKTILLTVILLAGCASTTGVVSTGKDTYMIAREDISFLARLGDIKAASFKDAASFCAGKGKTMELIKESDTPRSLGQFPQTHIQFSCI